MTKKGRVKAKSKPKIKRRHKMEYKCVGKVEAVVHINFQETNEHGAKNNIVKSMPYYTLNFQFYYDHNRLLELGEDAPSVLNAQFNIQTRLKEVYDKYEIGGTYKDLPISV